MFLKEGVDLCRSPPVIVLALLEHEDVIPHGFDYHFRVVNQPIEQFILDLAVKLILQHLYKVHYHLHQLN